MSYELEFLEEALAEWKRLDGSIKAQFKKKLAERLENPAVPADRLSGSHYRYKIKLRAAGYRLVYEVREQEIAVVVIAVGKRERGEVYRVGGEAVRAARLLAVIAAHKFKTAHLCLDRKLTDNLQLMLPLVVDCEIFITNSPRNSLDID